LKSNDDDIDAIIMNGDFISHNLPVGKDSATTQQILDAWALMKSDMQNVFDILRSKI
jgi:hypothetical protein